jgi:hypothetical protein
MYQHIYKTSAGSTIVEVAYRNRDAIWVLNTRQAFSI